MNKLLKCQKGNIAIMYDGTKVRIIKNPYNNNRVFVKLMVTNIENEAENKELNNNKHIANLINKGTY